MAAIASLAGETGSGDEPQPARYIAPNGCEYKAPTYEEKRQHRKDAGTDRTLGGIAVLTVPTTTKASENDHKSSRS